MKLCLLLWMLITLTAHLYTCGHGLQCNLKPKDVDESVPIATIGPSTKNSDVPESTIVVKIHTKENTKTVSNQKFKDLWDDLQTSQFEGDKLSVLLLGEDRPANFIGFFFPSIPLSTPTEPLPPAAGVNDGVTQPSNTPSKKAADEPILVEIDAASRVSGDDDNTCAAIKCICNKVINKFSLSDTPLDIDRDPGPTIVFVLTGSDSIYIHYPGSDLRLPCAKNPGS